MNTDLERQDVIEAKVVGGYIEYDSNNSGGKWWLSDEDWGHLEDAGWEIEWTDQTGKQDGFIGPNRAYGNPRPPFTYDAARFLGALADRARVFGMKREDAIRNWEEITSKSASDVGCSCCGRPHTFYTVDEEGHTHYAWEDYDEDDE